MFGDEDADTALGVAVVIFSLGDLSTLGIHTLLRLQHLTSDSLPKFFHSINKLHLG